MTTATASKTAFSVVIPIHNENRILLNELSKLVQEFKHLETPYELVLCENGSTDQTLELARQFQSAHPHVRLEQLDAPNYGLALKHAIAASRQELVVIFNIDFWDAEFTRQAVQRLADADMVNGSKRLPGAVDRRPFSRRLITLSFNAFLRLFFGFRGTDTHGMKAFRRTPMLEILEKCVTDHFILDTEMVLRAERAGLRIAEIPVKVREIRRVSYRSLLRRTPEVFWNLGRLWFALRSDR